MQHKAQINYTNEIASNCIKIEIYSLNDGKIWQLPNYNTLRHNVNRSRNKDLNYYLRTPNDPR